MNINIQNILKKSLTPKTLFLIPILLLFLILIYVFVDNYLYQTDKNSLSWYKNLQTLRFTSYTNKNYGTFFVSTQIFLASHSPQIDYLDSQKSKISHLIRQTISQKNYYHINTDFKRKIHLTPLLIQKINQLFPEEHQIIDISYSQFNIYLNPNISYQQIQHFNLGNFQIPFSRKTFTAQVYAIYESNSQIFQNSLLLSKPLLRQKIISSLKSQIPKYSQYATLKPVKNLVKNHVESIVEKHFNNVEQTLSKKILIPQYPNQFQSIFFGFFTSKKIVKP